MFLKPVLAGLGLALCLTGTAPARAQGVIWETASSLVTSGPDYLDHGIVFADDLPLSHREAIVEGIRALVEAGSGDPRLFRVLGLPEEAGYPAREMVADWIVSSDPVITMGCYQVGELIFEPDPLLRPFPESTAFLAYGVPDSMLDDEGIPCRPEDDGPDGAVGSYRAVWSYPSEIERAMLLLGTRAVAALHYGEETLPVVRIWARFLSDADQEDPANLAVILAHELHHWWFRSSHVPCWNMPGGNLLVGFRTFDQGAGRHIGERCDTDSNGAYALSILLTLSRWADGPNCEIGSPPFETLLDARGYASLLGVERQQGWQGWGEPLITNVPTDLAFEVEQHVAACVASQGCGSMGCDAQDERLAKLTEERAELTALFKAGELPGWRVAEPWRGAIVERGAASRWLEAIDAGRHEDFNVALRFVLPCEVFAEGCFQPEAVMMGREFVPPQNPPREPEVAAIPDLTAPEIAFGRAGPDLHVVNPLARWWSAPADQAGRPELPVFERIGDDYPILLLQMTYGPIRVLECQRRGSVDWCLVESTAETPDGSWSTLGWVENGYFAPYTGSWDDWAFLPGTYRIRADAPAGYYNIRQGPSTSGPVVGRIPAGMRGVRVLIGGCEPIGSPVEEADWCMIPWRGYPKWITADALQRE